MPHYLDSNCSLAAVDMSLSSKVSTMPQQATRCKAANTLVLVYVTALAQL